MLYVQTILHIIYLPAKMHVAECKQNRYESMHENCNSLICGNDVSTLKDYVHCPQNII